LVKEVRNVNISIKLKRICKKLQIPVAVLATGIASINGLFKLYDRIHLFISISKNENLMSTKIIRIEKGETKQIFEDNLFLITIDNILLIEEDHLYKIVVKLDNGFFTTRISEKTQGESITFDRYIIQIIKITTDYVEFRITLSNNH